MIYIGTRTIETECPFLAEFTLNQKKEFIDRGWIHVPSAVPEARVREALKAINAALGMGIDPRQLAIFQNQSFCPELREAPVITELFSKTPVRELVGSMAGKLVSCHPKAQIALRFPREKTGPLPLVPHIDGFYTPTNGLKKGSIDTFMGVVGILLQDVQEDWAGNFTVWPGTHKQFQDYFQNHEPRSETENGIPPVDLPSPIQWKGKAGDMVLTHYQLAHAAAPNQSPWVRYMVFFRFSCEAHTKRGLEVFRKIWLDWDGLEPLVSASE